jgi:hypothetical protein
MDRKMGFAGREDLPNPLYVCASLFIDARHDFAEYGLELLFSHCMSRRDQWEDAVHHPLHFRVKLLAFHSARLKRCACFGTCPQFAASRESSRASTLMSRLAWPMQPTE